jgi:hypothetical protein
VTDKHLAPVIKTWLQGTDRPPPDSHRSTGQIMARLPERERRRRWWPFHRQTLPVNEAPTTGQTTDYQPSPIPATNGHTPTVTGRTQSMFSPIKAITAGALVFAIGGVLLIAQPFDQQDVAVPGAQPDEGGVTGVTVTVTQECVEFDPCRWTASDPRLTGIGRVVWGDEVMADELADGEEAGLQWISQTFEGPEGIWTGHVYVLWGRPTQNFLVLSGTGANEGWHYIASGTEPYPPVGDFEWIGTLYEGELPPFPEPAE